MVYRLGNRREARLAGSPTPLGKDGDNHGILIKMRQNCAGYSRRKGFVIIYCVILFFF